MAKRLKGVSLKRQEKWFLTHKKSLDNGRYIPFWRVEDIRSRGIKVKIRHFSDPDRVIHLLSINELHMYVFLAWNQNIKEVYEQFAIPLEDTIRIAEDKGIKHPVYSDTRTPAIQTIDFMCVDKNNGDIAYIVKESIDLESERTQEKLDIQRIYCHENGIKVEEFESDDLKAVEFENLVRLYDHASIEEALRKVFENWFSNFIGPISDNKCDIHGKV